MTLLLAILLTSGAGPVGAGVDGLPPDALYYSNPSTEDHLLWSPKIQDPMPEVLGVPTFTFLSPNDFMCLGQDGNCIIEVHCFDELSMPDHSWMRIHNTDDGSYIDHFLPFPAKNTCGTDDQFVYIPDYSSPKVYKCTFDGAPLSETRVDRPQIFHTEFSVVNDTVWIGDTLYAAPQFGTQYGYACKRFEGGYIESDNTWNVGSGPQMYTSTAFDGTYYYIAWSADAAGGAFKRFNRDRTVSEEGSVGSRVWSLMATAAVPVLHDVCCTEIVVPAGTVDWMTAQLPQCRVYNLGEVPESYSVRMRIGEAYEDVASVLDHAPGSEVTVTFSLPWTADPPGDLAVYCATELEGDMHPENDAQSGLVRVVKHDVGCTAILEPSGDCEEGAVISPAAVVENFGSETEDFSVAFEIRDGVGVVYYSGTYLVEDLPSGSTREVSFDPPSWLAAPAQDYNAVCRTVLVSDMVSSNDETQFEFTVNPRVPWVQLADVPGSKLVDAGGALTNDGTYIYAMKGAKTGEFYRYSTDAGWLDLPALPGQAGAGAGLAYLDGWVYAMAGNKTRGFYRYDVAEGLWYALPQLPFAPKDGGALVGDGARLYALRGDNTLEFYGYTAGDGWVRLADVPRPRGTARVAAGGALAIHGTTVYAFKGGSSPEFYEYDGLLNTWTRLSDVSPSVVAEGGALGWRDGSVFAFMGGGTATFRRCVPGSAWDDAEPIPLGSENKAVAWGGALTTMNGLVYALKGSKCNAFWVYHPLDRGAQVSPKANVTGAPQPTLAPDVQVVPGGSRCVALVLRTDAPTRLAVRLYDNTGRRLRTVCRMDGVPAGQHRMPLDLSGFAEGTYFLRVSISDRILTRKLVLR